MSGGGRPWWDSVPTIGAGQEQGSGDGRGGSWVDSVPTIAAEPPAKPPAPLELRGGPALDLTTVPADRAPDFQSWLERNQVQDLDHPDSHYDYRGAYMAGIEGPNAGGHWPDTFKQHGHPTFSEESQYSRGPGDGGTWQGDTFVPPVIPKSSSTPVSPETPPAGPYNQPYDQRITDVATPGPEGAFVGGVAKAAALGIPSIPLELGKAVFGSPSAEEAADPLMRASRIARMGNAPGTEMQPAAADMPNPAERVAAIPIETIKAIPGQIGTVLHDPDWEKKGEAATGLAFDALMLKGGLHAADRFVEGKAEGAQAPPGAPAPPPRPDEAAPTPSTADVTPKAEPGTWVDKVPVLPPEPPAEAPTAPPAPTATEAGRMLERARGREQEGNQAVTPPSSPASDIHGRIDKLQAQADALEAQANKIVPEPPGPGHRPNSELRQQLNAEADKARRIANELARKVPPAPKPPKPGADGEVLKAFDFSRPRGRVRILRQGKEGPYEQHADVYGANADEGYVQVIVRASGAKGGERLAVHKDLIREHLPDFYPASRDAGGVRLDQGPVRTTSGRELTPPKQKGTTKQRLRQIDEWLWKEALEETAGGDPLGSAEGRTRDYRHDLVKQLGDKTGKLRPLSPGDRDLLNDILFGAEREAKPAQKAPPLEGDDLRRQQLQGAIEASQFGIRANELKLEGGNPMGGRPYTAKEIAKIRSELEGHRANLQKYQAELESLTTAPKAEPTPGPKLNPPYDRFHELELRVGRATTRAELEQIRADITATRNSPGTQAIYGDLSVLQGKVTRAIKKYPPGAPKPEEPAWTKEVPTVPAEAAVDETAPIVDVEGRKRPLTREEKAQKAAQREANRGTRYAKATTDELMEQHHAVVDRIGHSKGGGSGWARYDDDIGMTRAGGSNRDARLEDDRRMLDGIEAELKRRNVSEDDLVAGYYEWLDRKGEREGMQQEESGRGMPRDASDFNPDALGSPETQGKDLFGKEARDRFLEGSVVQGPVYHGTRSDFSRFSKTKDLGYHFGTSEQASSRATTGRSRAVVRGPNVMPVYLSLKKPVRLRADFGDYAGSNWSFLSELVERGALTDAQRSKVWAASLGGKLRASSTRMLREILETKGYDGLAYPNAYEGAGESYAVFRPEQIKSATGNRGGYDPGRTSILDSPERQGDMFGAEQPTEPAQGGLFDEKAGTEATRSTAEQLRALQSEHEKLSQLIKGRLKDSPSANARLAELDRVLNRDKKITADEMATRARAKEPGTLEAPDDPDERVTAAAIRDPQTGKVHTGFDHRDVIEQAYDSGDAHLGDRLTEAYEAGRDGFQTNRREYVDREEAVDVARQARQLRYPKEFQGDEANTHLLAEDIHPDEIGRPGIVRGEPDALETPAARGRPYQLDDLDHAGAHQLDRWLSYEERLAQRELLEPDRPRDPGAPGPGEPAKSPDDLLALEHELQAAERKLKEVSSEKLKEILRAQVFNRTRQQEAYVREYVNAGRTAELDPLVRERFKDMKPGEQPRDQQPPNEGPRGDHYSQQRRAREEWERRMRQEAERRRQERERGRQQPPPPGGRRQRPPPPPPRQKPPPPPPPPSMAAKPNVAPPRNAAGPVKSLFRIGRMFADALDATVRTGRGNFKARKARGFFKLVNEAIRVQRGDWLDVIAHEVGHYISKRWLKHPTNRGAHARGAVPLTPAMMKELRDMGKALYGSRKPGLGYGEEGIAEWSNFYVTDPARARSEAPEFTKLMEGTVFKAEPQLKAAFEAAQEHYARHEHATPLERIDAQVNRKPTGRGFPPWRELTKTWLDDIHELKLAMQALKVGNFRESAYILGRLSRGSAGVAETWLEKGMRDIRDDRIVAPSVAEALDQVGPKHLREFGNYLVAESAIERWQAGINPGIRLQDARDVVRDLAPKYKAQAEVIWKHYNGLLAALRDVGKLSPQAYRAILEKNQRHVGFFRIFDESERPAGGGPGGRRWAGGGLARQTGSAREIIDPLESMMKDTYRVASQVARFETAKALVKADLREGGGHFVDEVPAPKVKTEIYAPRVLKQLQDLGLVKLDPVTGSVTPLVKEDLIGEVLSVFDERQSPGSKELKDLVIPVRTGDVTRWYQIMDRHLYDTIEGLEPPQLAGWLRVLSLPSRTLRAGATLTLEFMARNPVRDAMTAYVRTRGGARIPGTNHYMSLPLLNFAKGLDAFFRDEHLVDRYRLSGALGANLTALDRPAAARGYKALLRQHSHARAIEALRHPLSTKGAGKAIATSATHLGVDVVLHPIETLRLLSSISENLTRLGEYSMVEKRLQRAGAGPKESQTGAGFAARDVTQDFSMAGTAGRAMNQLVTFFNAQVNSVGNLVRDFKTRPQTVFPRIIAGVTIPSLALYYAQRHDPAYQKLPRWMRDFAFVWIQRGHDQGEGWDGYGTGKVEHRWALPKAFEMGVFFGSAAERLAEWSETHRPEAFEELGKSLVQAFAPGILPVGVKVAEDIRHNWDSYRDRPIVPRSRERLDPSEQFAPYTGETARTIGKLTGTSPAKIEYGVQGVAGGLGRQALGAADVGVRAFREAMGKPPMRAGTVLRPDKEGDPLMGVPVVKGFLKRDPQESATDIERTYRLFDAAERRRQTWMQLQKEGRTDEAQEYFKQHESEIRSVATKEQTGIGPGPLRAQYDAVTRLKQQSRAVPTVRRRNVGRMHGIIDRLKEAVK